MTVNEEIDALRRIAANPKGPDLSQKPAGSILAMQEAKGAKGTTGVNGRTFKINQGQQNKHIIGTNEYKTAASSGTQRSVLVEDPQSLLPKLGTGQQVGKIEVGLAGSKERIDFGKVIGNYVDKETNVSVSTTKGIVHYGKDSVHIVPSRP